MRNQFGMIMIIKSEVFPEALSELDGGRRQLACGVDFEIKVIARSPG
jgi:hypothetical protein